LFREHDFLGLFKDTFSTAQFFICENGYEFQKEKMSKDGVLADIHVGLPRIVGSGAASAATAQSSRAQGAAKWATKLISA
jgi:hypothetical protein